MPELRWTLLALGVLFIAALAWWELRKPRQARRGGELDVRGTGGVSRDSELDSAPRVYREPTINFPEVRPRKEPLSLPVVEMSDDSMIGLRMDGQRIEDDARESPIPEATILPSIDWRLDEKERHVRWSDDDDDDEETPEGHARAVDEELAHIKPPTIDSEVDIAERTIVFEPEQPVSEFYESQSREPGVARVREGAGSVIDSEFNRDSTEYAGEAALRRTSEGRIVSLSMPDHVEPVVNWPDESERQIISLRLVAPIDRFPGRALRQALSAEGFMLGKMDIFHKAGADGRAVLSAASLTRPGSFSLDTIDIQRFGGLNLFAVLPGPLPAYQAFDELLTTARSLNERLQGQLQDETGQPLTPSRLSAIRATLVNTQAVPAPIQADETSHAQVPEPPP